MSRTRTRLERTVKGHVKRYVAGALLTDKDVVSNDYSTCVDGTCKYPYTLPMPGNIFHVDRSGFKTVTGSSGNTQFGNFVENYMADFISGSSFGHLTVPDLPTVGSDALKVLAFSNPNRGKADIGQDIIDGFPMLPKKIFDRGHHLIDSTPDVSLWWYFGIGPVIEDLKELMKWKDLQKQRLAELGSLFQKGGLRRRISLGSYSATSTDPSVALQSQYFSMTGTLKTTTRVSRWGVVRWQPSGWNLPDYTKGELDSKVLRILYGMDLSPKEIWDKMPWTWLLGWFSSVGLWLAANQNNFPVIPGPVSIMTHWETTREFTNIAISSGFRGGGGTVSSETKERHIVPSGGLPLSFWRSPNGSFAKSSILGSLAAKYLAK